jgi:hypothetical protein
VQRLFSLSLTMAFVLATTLVAMDAGAAQCYGDSSCADDRTVFAPLRWLHVAPGSGASVAVAAVIPLAVVSLLWWLGHQSWYRYERVRPQVRNRDDQDGPTPETVVSREPTKEPTPEEDDDLDWRQLWNGQTSVGRLRAVHLVVSFGTIATTALLPVCLGPGSARSWPRVLLALDLLMVMGPSFALLWQEPWKRKAPDLETVGGDDGSVPAGRSQWASRFLRAWTTWMPWVALALLGASLVTLAVARPHVDPRSFSMLRGAVMVLVLTQLGLILTALVVVILAALPPARTVQDDSRRHGQGRALFGLAAPMTLFLAWLLSGLYSSGFALLGVSWMGTVDPGGVRTETSGSGQVPLDVPVVYAWFGALALLLAALAAFGAVFLVGRYLFMTWRRIRPMVVRDYGDLARKDGKRATEIAKLRARAVMPDLIAPVLGVVVALTFLAALWLTTWHLFGCPGSLQFAENVVCPDGGLATASRAGGWVTLAFVGGLAPLGFAVSRNSGLRRSVGILWDLGSFWPRATHPLAPPCYCERVLPDLIERVRWLQDGGPNGFTSRPAIVSGCDDVVVLSAHSQGSIIAAALIMQLDQAQRRKVGLVTYGNPLRRLYAPFFPAYFGSTTIHALGQSLAAVKDAPSSQWRWRNLYRRTDPIGGPVLTETSGSPHRHDTVLDGLDVCLEDPAFPIPAGGTRFPKAAGHFDYPSDPVYDQALETVLDLLGASPRPRKADPHKWCTPGCWLWRLFRRWAAGLRVHPSRERADPAPGPAGFRTAVPDPPTSPSGCRAASGRRSPGVPRPGRTRPRNSPGGTAVSGSHRS